MSSSEMKKKRGPYKKKYKPKECERSCCKNIFTPLRIDYRYCSKKCSQSAFNDRLKAERKIYCNTKTKKLPIPEKYLVRGNITYEGTKWNLC